MTCGSDLAIRIHIKQSYRRWQAQSFQFYRLLDGYKIGVVTPDNGRYTPLICRFFNLWTYFSLLKIQAETD